MRLYNYTTVVNREIKLYSIGGKAINGGISTATIIVFAPIIGFFVLLGFLISLPLNINMLNFIAHDWDYYYLLTFLIFGVAAASALRYIHVGSYRLYIYLLAYLRKKRVMTHDKKIYSHTNHKIAGIIEQIL